MFKEEKKSVLELELERQTFEMNRLIEEQKNLLEKKNLVKEKNECNLRQQDILPPSHINKKNLKKNHQ